MSVKRTPLSIVVLSLLLLSVLILVGAVGWQPKPGGLTGWTIIRTPAGVRLDVPVDWPVEVGPTTTAFASSDEALGSADSGLEARAFRALVVSGNLEDLPLPGGVDRSDVAATLAADAAHRGVSFRGGTQGAQAMLAVKEIAPDLYAGVFASAAVGQSFPYQRELEEIVGSLTYRPEALEGDSDTLDYWLDHVLDIHRSDHEPPLWYDLMVPEGQPPASGWPLLVLAHANTYSYAAIARDGLAIVVTPHFTWNTFEEDRQILDAVLDEVEAGYPVDHGRLVIHGCSVGGRFTFQYTVTEPERVYAAVPMAAFDVKVPPANVWHIPFVFFYGDQDTMYTGARAAIEGMQKTMDSVELYLDAGQGHTCDPALGLEAVRTFLAD